MPTTKLTGVRLLPKAHPATLGTVLWYLSRVVQQGWVQRSSDARREQTMSHLDLSLSRAPGSWPSWGCSELFRLIKALWALKTVWDKVEQGHWNSPIYQPMYTSRGRADPCCSRAVLPWLLPTTQSCLQFTTDILLQDEFAPMWTFSADWQRQP